MFTDPRTWSTLLYMLLMLPLGIVYFTIAVTGMTLSLALHGRAGRVAVCARSTSSTAAASTSTVDMFMPPIIALPLHVPLGVFLLFGMLHLARGVGKFQGAIAKHLLVPSAG